MNNGYVHLCRDNWVGINVNISGVLYLIKVFKNLPRSSLLPSTRQKKPPQEILVKDSSKINRPFKISVSHINNRTMMCILDILICCDNSPKTSFSDYIHKIHNEYGIGFITLLIPFFFSYSFLSGYHINTKHQSFKNKTQFQ